MIRRKCRFLSVVLYTYWKWFCRLLSPSPRPPTLTVPSPQARIALGCVTVLPCDCTWQYPARFHPQPTAAALNNHQVKKLWVMSCSFVSESERAGLALQITCPPHHWKTPLQVAQGTVVYPGLYRSSVDSPARAVVSELPGHCWRFLGILPENTGSARAELCSGAVAERRLSRNCAVFTQASI